jgi:hypothetical protein
MEVPRSHQPGSPGASPSAADGTSWSAEAKLPVPTSASSLIRPEADSCELIAAPDARAIMNRLSVLSAQLECGEIVVPTSVSHVAIKSLVAEWRLKGNLDVGRNSSGEFIVRSNPGNEEFESFFAVLSPGKLPLIAGLLTDRDLKEHWPKVWQDYSDFHGKTLLDHCCGLGQKVRLLRQQGVEAHGVDIVTFGSLASEGLHYGRAERLPFKDQTFDRAESRMGVLLWGQDNKEMCRQTLAEMVRVTKDGGTIRVMPVREALLQELVAERPDLSFVDQPTGFFGAFELRVQRPQGS